MKDKKNTWESFQKTGCIEDYINFKSLKDSPGENKKQKQFDDLEKRV